MPLFNQQISQPGSTFRPVVTPADTTTPEALKQVGSIFEGLATGIKERREAEQEAEQASEFAGLFSDTLQTEAEVLQGQEELTANQEGFDALLSDGIISEEEQGELAKLQRERALLEDVTNPRQRQVQLRMKFANFVNRFPHLTKEARIMFGDADSRLEDVAQGTQALVDQQAFEEIYGQNRTAENISRFRQLQKFNASRKVASTYGEANFQDWSAGFNAEVTTDLYTIGERINQLVMRQGSLRTEDIDAFNSQIDEGFFDAVRTIDLQVLELQKAGQIVSPQQVQAMKATLEDTRELVKGMTEEKDFTTRMTRLNKAMDEHFKYQMNVQLGGVAKLFAGEGGGGAKGGADLITLRQVLAGGPSIDAAKELPGPYGESVRNLQQGAIDYMNFLDEYDPEAVAQFVSPAMARELASMQSIRVDNGITKTNPEAVAVLVDTMERGGTSDETAEGLLERSKTVNDAAIRNNESKAKLSSFVNNYALETEELLRSVGARVQKTPEGLKAFVTNNDGTGFRPFAIGTTKLNNLSRMYREMPVVGDLKDLENLVDNYKNTLNEEIQTTIDTLKLEEMPEALREKTLNRLQIQYSLTEQEMQQIREQLRGNDDAEASGD